MNKWLTILLLFSTNSFAQDYFIKAVDIKKTQYQGVHIVKEVDPKKHITLDCQGFIHEIRVLNNKKKTLFYKPISEVECLFLEQSFKKAEQKDPVCIKYKQRADRFFKAEC